MEPDPGTGEWAVWCPELSGCVSAGKTQLEALNNIREAIRLYLEPSDLEAELPLGAVIEEVAVFLDSVEEAAV